MRRTERTSPLLEGPHSESQHLVFDFDFFFSLSGATSEGCNDRSTLRVAEVSSSKCRREYDLMMVMSPTWGFWQKRMARGEGA